MADVSAGDIPDEGAAALCARPDRPGVPRGESVRGLLARHPAAGTAVSLADLAWFADRFSGLADPALMARAWQ
jgi:hypothetical protein